LISELEIEQFIGKTRWAEYCEPFRDKNLDFTIECYRFDCELRGILMSAIAVIEVALVTQLQLAGNFNTFESFGQARRALDTLPDKASNQIARNLGATNFRKLRGALQNLNYLRNRVAHHERVWNHRNRFAFPQITDKPHFSLLGYVTNRHVLAFSIIGIATLIETCPKVFDFEERLITLVESHGNTKLFLLNSMGFEVP
jgi:abortive infection bacteriophage resistance protein